MTEQQTHAESHDPAANPQPPAGEQQGVPAKPKKKASWLRTILWMLGMMLLINVIMGIIAYFMFRK